MYLQMFLWHQKDVTTHEFIGPGLIWYSVTLWYAMVMVELIQFRWEVNIARIMCASNGTLFLKFHKIFALNI